MVICDSSIGFCFFAVGVGGRVSGALGTDDHRFVRYRLADLPAGAGWAASAAFYTGQVSYHEGRHRVGCNSPGQ